MEEAKSSRRYSLGPPWIFKGRQVNMMLCLIRASSFGGFLILFSCFCNSVSILSGQARYQLHLVKADMVRALVPKDLRLVEAFGYTLGGMFLAHYEDSPAGAFDELVTIAGIVWNPPTSCAWASRVLVSSHEACQHGRKDVGLPSHYASFSKIVILTLKLEQSHFYDMVLYSGNTDHNPHLLKYSCQISCSIRAVEPAKITAADSLEMSCGNESQIDDASNSTLASIDSSNSKNVQVDSSTENEERQRSISVLLSKPILALEFNHMTMQVDAPHVVIHKPGKMR
ncbi:hypothetical protein EJ110_NYTH23520 [Nymphaea thermarum]|nr:hypothetical protein EJ110_NYTH23520 [Nymphaea thermarum]